MSKRCPFHGYECTKEGCELFIPEERKCALVILGMKKEAKNKEKKNG